MSMVDGVFVGTWFVVWAVDKEESVHDAVVYLAAGSRDTLLQAALPLGATGGRHHRLVVDLVNHDVPLA